MPAQTSAFEKRVRACGHPRVHVLSAFDPDQTRCGLRMVPPVFFEKTDDAANCPFCTRPPQTRKTA